MLIAKLIFALPRLSALLPTRLHLTGKRQRRCVRSSANGKYCLKFWAAGSVVQNNLRSISDTQETPYRSHGHPMRIDNSSILAIHPVTNARMGSEAHSWEAKAVRHETPSSGALLRLRESGDLDADNNAQGDELVGAMVKGDRDLRSLASPSDAGIDTHSRLSIKVGDGTWVKVQFESFQRISVTKDGLTTLFAYTSASGSWPESLVRAFNSIGGGLTSSISSEGRLQLTSSLNDPIHIANEPSGEVNPPPGLASALGLPEGLSPDWYSGEDQLRTGHRRAASSVNLLSGALDQQDAGKGGIFPLARDAYAETTRA